MFKRRTIQALITNKTNKHRANSRPRFFPRLHTNTTRTSGFVRIHYILPRLPLSLVPASVDQNVVVLFHPPSSSLFLMSLLHTDGWSLGRIIKRTHFVRTLSWTITHF